MSNSIKGSCPFEHINHKCPFGKPFCTVTCDYRKYISRFLKLKIEYSYVVRFFRMYRRWQIKYLNDICNS